MEIEIQCLSEDAVLPKPDSPGVRTAQLIIQRFDPYMPVEVEALSEPVQGSKGFGDTGK